MKNTITRNAYAKINLGLDVTGVREDAGVYKWNEEGHKAFQRFLGTL